MTSDSSLSTLLYQTSAINKKYGEISQLTGENFNIFKVLGVESSEVRLHSMFLAELLNPNGNHGQSHKFLKLFLVEIGVETFNWIKAEVKVEKHIGYLNSDNTEGGRIDIVIDNKSGKGILIENKIYAADQYKQLLRYHNYGKDNFYNSHKLIYLTLNGKEPDQSSTGDFLEKDQHFIVLSYEIDITRWLENCKKEAVNHPILRETISQYINLIRYLTGKSINKQMEKEVVQTINLNAGNFESAHIIKDSLDDSYVDLLNTFHKQLTGEADKRNLEISWDVNFYSIDTGFSFTNSFLKTMNLEIRFEFDGKRTSGLSFGFAKIDAKIPFDPNDKEKITLAFIKKFGKTDQPYDNWPCWQYFDEIRNWNRNTYLEIIKNTLTQKIVEKLETMLSIVENFEVRVSNIQDHS